MRRHGRDLCVIMAPICRTRIQVLRLGSLVSLGSQVPLILPPDDVLRILIQAPYCTAVPCLQHARWMQPISLSIMWFPLEKAVTLKPFDMDRVKHPLEKTFTHSLA